MTVRPLRLQGSTSPRVRSDGSSLAWSCDVFRPMGAGLKPRVAFEGKFVRYNCRENLNVAEIWTLALDGRQATKTRGLGEDCGFGFIYFKHQSKHRAPSPF